MTSASIEPRLIAAGRLEEFVGRAFQAGGIPPDDVGSIAQLMTGIDLRGLDGHGVFRLTQYIQRIKAGGINVEPNIRIARETDSTALIDGDNALATWP